MDTEKLPNQGYTKDFTTGARRDGDIGRGRPSLIPPIALRSLAKRFEDGGKLYGDNNWRKGFPLTRLYDSMFRHLLALAEGDETEDHAGAILWNASAWLWTKDQIKRGNLPIELDDIEKDDN
jgi:hypothetical protein